MEPSMRALDCRLTLVVPCYNEAQRLPLASFRAFLNQASGVCLLFVNDGSTDDTLAVLNALRVEFPQTVDVLDQPKNAGKAEAVRAGMIRASTHHAAPYTGFWDADLATPLEEIPRLLALLLERPAIDILLGSRVRLLGRSVHRRALRHYSGRIFASLASLALSAPVYDTQCGAKLFRATPTLNHVLDEPFHSPWIFDVELIARFLADHPRGRAQALQAIYEEPLREWQDVPGSKLKFQDSIKAIGELIQIRRKYFKDKPGARLKSQGNFGVEAGHKE